MIQSDNTARRFRAGIVYGILAYSTWGLGPIYFKAVSEVSPMEILAHRIVWSIAFLLPASIFLKNFDLIKNALKSFYILKYLGISTILIAINWYTFIWSIENNQVLQASLGYFINPLLSVLLGSIFLKETLSRNAKISLLFALIGVSILLLKSSVLPIPGLVLAVTFALYGLLRKIAPVGSVVGLTVETILLGPIALLYLIVLSGNNTLVFLNYTADLDFLLMAAGPITSFPLIWFAKGARRLRLSLVGFLQYLTPTLQFFLAVVIYNEPFDPVHLSAFACIWSGLALFTVDSFRRHKNRHK